MSRRSYSQTSTGFEGYILPSNVLNQVNYDQNIDDIIPQEFTEQRSIQRLTLNDKSPINTFSLLTIIMLVLFAVMSILSGSIDRNFDKIIWNFVLFAGTLMVAFVISNAIDVWREGRRLQLERDQMKSSLDMRIRLTEFQEKKMELQKDMAIQVMKSQDVQMREELKAETARQKLDIEQRERERKSAMFNSAVTATGHLAGALLIRQF